MTIAASTKFNQGRTEWAVSNTGVHQNPVDILFKMGWSFAELWVAASPGTGRMTPRGHELSTGATPPMGDGPAG